MRLRMRAAATAVAVLALLTPAVAAHADPVLTATVASSESPVLPAIDGLSDTTEISGTVDSSAGTQRIRGTVVVSLGARVAKTWVLSSTGPFSFTWDGRIGASIVPGTYTITVRVAGMPPMTPISLPVSAKKITAVTWTKTVTAESAFDGCDIPVFFSCRTGDLPFGGHTTGIIIDARVAEEDVYAYFSLSLPSAVRNSLRDPKFTVSTKASVTGSRTNSVIAYAGDPCFCGDYTEKTFKKSGTVSATVTMWAGESRAYWDVWVSQRNYVVMPTFTIKIVYYALR